MVSIEPGSQIGDVSILFSYSDYYTAYIYAFMANMNVMKYKNVRKCKIIYNVESKLLRYIALLHLENKTFFHRS